MGLYTTRQTCTYHDIWDRYLLHYPTFPNWGFWNGEKKPLMTFLCLKNIIYLNQPPLVPHTLCGGVMTSLHGLYFVCHTMWPQPQATVVQGHAVSRKLSLCKFPVATYTPWFIFLSAIAVLHLQVLVLVSHVAMEVLNVTSEYVHLHIYRDGYNGLKSSVYTDIFHLLTLLGPMTSVPCPPLLNTKAWSPSLIVWYPILSQQGTESQTRYYSRDNALVSCPDHTPEGVVCMGTYWGYPFHSKERWGTSRTRVAFCDLTSSRPRIAMGNTNATARCAGEGTQQPATLPPLPPLTAGDREREGRGRIRDWS